MKLSSCPKPHPAGRRGRPWRQRLRPLALAALLAFSGVAPPGLAQVRLPSLGEAAADEFTAGTERRLGEQIMGMIVRDPLYLDDPVLVEYIQSLWAPLVATARQRGEMEPDVDTQFAWETFLVRDRAVNAFALPGGWVGVYLGLIALTSTSDELASVLAHELSHVTQRHIARGQVAASKQGLLTMVATILGMLAASRSNNADALQAVVVGGQAAAIQGQLNFSRDMEREADRIGFGILTGAGFAPSGMANMFEKLDGASRINDSGSFPYLRSHPLTVDRMSEARSRGLVANAPPPRPTARHAMMQARARVLMDGNPQALRRWQEQIVGPSNATPTGRLGQLYAAAMASSQLREHDKAEAALQEALKAVVALTPAEPAAERDVQLLLAQTRLARGDALAAVAALDAVKAQAGARAPMFLRAQAALELQRLGTTNAGAELRSSTEALQTWLADHPRDGGAWAMLSATADAAGLRLRSLRANAEARAAEGDLGGAIDRLRAAQAAARSATGGQDFIEASIIDARLRDLQGQRRQLALEAQGNRGPRDPSDAPPPQ